MSFLDTTSYYKIHCQQLFDLLVKPLHEIFNNTVCTTGEGSDQPANTRRLISAFASCEYFMTVKLLIEQKLEILSSTRGCFG